MKDTKIFVDIDDEITFVAEKIVHAQTNRVILVVPEKSEIISSLIGLRMLRKVIDKNDKNIIIVTTDDTGKNIAEKAGFLVDEKIGNINENTWINAISLKKRINDSEKLSKKHVISSEVYEAINNTNNDLHKEQGFEMVNQENLQNESTEDEKGFEMVNQETPNIDNKDTNGNAKKVILEDFEFLVGGDVASNVSNKDKNDSYKENENIKRTFTKKGDQKKNRDLSSILNKIPKRNKSNKKNKIVIAMTIFILLIIFIVYYLFLANSSITITTKGSIVKNSTIITVNPNISNISTSNMQIPSKILSVAESGSDSTKTTGTKNVSSGSYASGSVTIGNYTSNPIPLPSGIILTDSNGYTCQTTSAVTVPAASSPFSAGTVNANVIATNTNNPAPANDIFTVSGYSQSKLIANNTNAFSSGNYTTTTEQVVSQNDQNSLKQSLTSQLFSKGKSSLSSQSNNNQIIIPQSIKYVIVNATFDKQVGTPAQVLNLSEQIKVEGQSYSKNNIQALLKKKLEDSSNSIKNLQYTINTVSINSTSNITISVNYSAEIFKNLNKQNILSSVKGKSFSSAVKIISSIKNVSGVKISETPSIFSIFGYLPSNIKMININIKN